jgi:short subunit dehydrogenase-like uncharacterized protein
MTDGSTERDYDLVLFGATGFTGRLVARYLAGAIPDDARWALGGRSREKLEAVRARLTAARPSAAATGQNAEATGQHAAATSQNAATADPRGSAPAIVIADSTDPDSLRTMAASTRVVISTVGPYLRHGEPLVAACAAAGTDYLDLAGEPEFVDLMYLHHHRQAVETGARLVHSCGFDSVPYDLGALWTVSQFDGTRPIALRGFGLMGGGISGGTYHSIVGALGRLKEAGRVARERRVVEYNAPDGALAAERSVHGYAGRPHREPIAGGWVVPAPTIDPQVVLRSARALEGYGPDFSYSHYIVTGSLLKTAGLFAGLGLVTFMAQLSRTRRLILRLKARGEGPSEARRARSFFRIRFIAEAGAAGAAAGAARLVTGARAGESVEGEAPGSADGVRVGRLVTEVRGGDPGYDETAKMLSEAGLAMAFDNDLPSAGRGGQMTPAVAFGHRLIERLSAAGIEFRTVS